MPTQVLPQFLVRLWLSRWAAERQCAHRTLSDAHHSEVCGGGLRNSEAPVSCCVCCRWTGCGQRALPMPDTFCQLQAGSGLCLWLSVTSAACLAAASAMLALLVMVVTCSLSCIYVAVASLPAPAACHTWPLIPHGTHSYTVSLQVGSPRAAQGLATSGAATAAQMAAAAALAVASAGEAPGVVGAAAGPADLQVSKTACLPAWTHPTILTVAALQARQQQGQAESHGRQPASPWQVPFCTAACVCQVSACWRPLTAHSASLLLL